MVEVAICSSVTFNCVSLSARIDLSLIRTSPGTCTLYLFSISRLEGISCTRNMEGNVALDKILMVLE